MKEPGNYFGFACLWSIVMLGPAIALNTADICGGWLGSLIQGVPCVVAWTIGLCLKVSPFGKDGDDEA